MTMNNQNPKHELMTVKLIAHDPIFEVWREDGQFNEKVATFYIPGMGDEYVRAMNETRLTYQMALQARKDADSIVALQGQLAHMEQNAGEAKLLALGFKQQLINQANAISAFLGDNASASKSWLMAEVEKTKELLNQ